jgi:hypothetical protein
MRTVLALAIVLSACENTHHPEYHPQTSSVVTQVYSTAPVVIQNEACEPDSGIEVLAASYGSVCGSARGNRTRNVASSCNGKHRCDYLVDNRDGDPFFNCPKDFSVSWRCSRTSPARSAGHARQAYEDYTVTLSCE